MNALLTRRHLLRHSLLGAAGLWLADSLLPRAWGASSVQAVPGTSPVKAGQAKSVIQVWLWGGPSHLDTFDPKPEAGSDYSGPLKAIDTNVPGVRICDQLPLLAKQADKYVLVRGMTHGSNAHETAAYMTQTGREAGQRIVYPGIGAVVTFFRGYGGGYQGRIPPYIVLTEAQGRFDEAGFLGSRYKPFATGGDPSQPRFAVEGIVAQGISDQQQRDRRELLHRLDTLARVLPDDPSVKALAESEEQAYDMILGEGARVFDLNSEADELRERYGRTKFGQSCLMARRLVERGVPYITINSGGWDTHKDHFTAMRRKLPELDRCLSALIQDLADRCLLDSTIVWCGGEFGRTPRIQWEAPWNGGRGHYGKAFSTLLAGGGFRGGCVVGATDARGEEVRERPVRPCDLLGSLYDRLGIDGAAKLPHPLGLEAHVMPDAGDGIATAGILREVM